MTALDKSPAHPSVPLADRLTWSYDDLEALTGLGRRSWERAVAAGRLKPIRVGRRILFPRQAVLEFLGSSHAKGGRDPS